MLYVTRREYEVLEWLQQGHSNKELATLMGVSPASVKKYMSRLFDKTGMGDRLELALWWVAKRGGVTKAIDDKHYQIP
jgi:DNA-binding CsgD family transcriptional regulator